MGGATKVKTGTLNELAVYWVFRFLELRCVVRAAKFEYVTDLYLAYLAYAKENSAGGYNLALTRNRFGRILNHVFKENNWPLESMNTPDGRQRIRVGLCLKENITERNPEDLYTSLEKVEKGSNAAKSIAGRRAALQSNHFNPETADRASEDAGVSQTENDRRAKELWDKGE